MAKKEVEICPNCGSYDITPLEPTTILAIGGWLPVKYTCRDCGYRGLPLILDSIECYKRFLKEKRKSKERSKKPKQKKTPVR